MIDGLAIRAKATDVENGRVDVDGIPFPITAHLTIFDSSDGRSLIVLTEALQGNELRKLPS